MRAFTVTIFVMLVAACTLSSCTKLASYKNYDYYCSQVVNGNVVYEETYGVQATNWSDAGVYCNDIESRVNDYNESSGFDRRVDCKLR
ncbi:MAG: hypothetical protein KDC07_11655 [Chitinophagaceae bacterium]|nr:hypothetical protein [Chitinophagaceae bacterium]